jgi:hypothetical protein
MRAGGTLPLPSAINVQQMSAGQYRRGRNDTGMVDTPTCHTGSDSSLRHTVAHRILHGPAVCLGRSPTSLSGERSLAHSATMPVGALSGGTIDPGRTTHVVNEGAVMRLP